MQSDYATSLRKEPDKIIIGEVRGQDAFDLIKAMSKSKGSLGTFMASEPPIKTV